MGCASIFFISAHNMLHFCSAQCLCIYNICTNFTFKVACLCFGVDTPVDIDGQYLGDGGGVGIMPANPVATSIGEL